MHLVEDFKRHLQERRSSCFPIGNIWPGWKKRKRVFLPSTRHWRDASRILGKFILASRPKGRKFTICVKFSCGCTCAHYGWGGSNVNERVRNQGIDHVIITIADMYLIFVQNYQVQLEYSISLQKLEQEQEQYYSMTRDGENDLIFTFELKSLQATTANSCTYASATSGKLHSTYLNLSPVTFTFCRCPIRTKTIRMGMTLNQSLPFRNLLLIVACDY
jgi:hypothetical protein